MRVRRNQCYVGRNWKKTCRTPLALKGGKDEIKAFLEREKKRQCGECPIRDWSGVDPAGIFAPYGMKVESPANGMRIDPSNMELESLKRKAKIAQLRLERFYINRKIKELEAAEAETAIKQLRKLNIKC